MNIKQAKEQVRKTCIAYLTKDAHGDYAMPVETQRPIFLLGAPGIGKTAIMAQVAEELGLGLVDYSMTHHTRQSAIGLPFITERTYDGQETEVSEYTMSEIIASVHHAMETTGRKEGILFLDEINCVSETLTPMMLRFLQSKMLGNHRVPDGWVVVSAGNPLEYNKSARDFDVVTMDRVKLIEVEPDLAAWREYAVSTGAHPAVISFLDMRPDCFYHMETKGRSRHFVTARAWMDLSNMMRLYERNGLELDDELVGQYLQAPAIAKDFATYLRLFAAYTADYRIPEILAGNADEALVAKAAKAGFDERAALCGLLTDSLAAKAGDLVTEDKLLAALRSELVAAKETGEGAAEFLQQRADAHAAELEADAARFRANLQARAVKRGTIEALQQWATEAKTQPQSALHELAQQFNRRLGAQQAACDELAAQVKAALEFIEAAFGQGNEMTIALNEMTMNGQLGSFIANHGVEAYYQRSETLMLDVRAERLTQRMQELQ